MVAEDPEPGDADRWVFQPSKPPRRPRSRWTEVVAAMLGAVLAACVAAIVIAATVRIVTWTLGL